MNGNWTDATTNANNGTAYNGATFNIVIKVIPHSKQRYETVGDYFYDHKKVLQVRISELGDWRYNFLVMIHELCEIGMCLYMRIDFKLIDMFDKNFEKARAKDNTDEPGDDPDCPYRIPHLIATGIEKILAGFIGVNWKVYDDKVMSL